jgi:hypothetical protein
MSSSPVLSATASAALLVLLAAPAAAGDYYGYHGGYSAGRNCTHAHPRVRVIYGVAPVTYYETKQIYVRQTVTVPRHSFVPTQQYVVDQGPSFDVPAVTYSAPRVYYPSGDYYPWAGRRPAVYYGVRYRGHYPGVHRRHSRWASVAYRGDHHRIHQRLRPAHYAPRHRHGYRHRGHRFHGYPVHRRPVRWPSK